MAEEIAELLRETRETMLAGFGEIRGKLDAVLAIREVVMQRLEENEERLLRVEGFCEEKRRAIAKIQPVVACMFGTGPHDPGVLSRTKAIEEAIGFGTDNITICAKVSDLQKRAITWQSLAALVGVFSGLWTIVAGLGAGAYYWLVHMK